MGLVRIEIHADRESAPAALDIAKAHPYSASVALHKGAVLSPPGDLITVDVPRESASSLLEDLERQGLMGGANLVTVNGTMSHLGSRADHMECDARGFASDALLWNVVRDTLEEEDGLSFVFIGSMVLATLLATIGIITNSAILVVGAMVIGPEFGPIALFCISLLGKRWSAVRSAWTTVTIGFVIAVACSAAFALALRMIGVFPDELDHEGLVREVASPGWLSLVIALIAGAAGMLAVTSSRSSALVGVLISVTTIPAAGDAALFLIYGDEGRAGKALLTLVINLGGVSIAGTCTLALQRWLVPRLSPPGRTSVPT